MTKKTRKRAPSKKQSTNSALVNENYKYLPINNIVVEGWNYKKTDETLQKKLENNIKKNGQIENLLVRDLGDGSYGLVNGHHRLDALKALNMDEAFVYDLGEISLELAKRIGIETNETKFESDNVQLAELLSELSTEFGLEDIEMTMPFSGGELENFSKLLEFDWEDAEASSNNEEEDTTDNHKSSTVVSAGGDKFITVKLELAPDLADFFETQIARLKPVAKGSEDKPIELMLNYIAKANVEDILEASKSPSKRRAKKKNK